MAKIWVLQNAQPENLGIAKPIDPERLFEVIREMVSA